MIGISLVHKLSPTGTDAEPYHRLKMLLSLPKCSHISLPWYMTYPGHKEFANNSFPKS